MSTFIIGECAATHDGDLSKAFRLIDLCADIGADAAKFQYLSSAERLVARRRAPEYLNAYKLLELPPSWLGLLAQKCATRGIELLSSVYLAEDVGLVAPHVSRLKLASFEFGDEMLLDVCLAFKKPVVISLGMAAKFGMSMRYLPDGSALLHCVSSYPTPDEEINLRRVSALRDEFDTRLHIGLSDHTRHPQTGAYAVCAGAEVVEFHLRLDETSPKNADYEVAKTPEEARQYIENIRLAEKMLGSGARAVQPSEEKMLRYRVGGEA